MNQISSAAPPGGGPRRPRRGRRSVRRRLFWAVLGGGGIACIAGIAAVVVFIVLVTAIVANQIAARTDCKKPAAAAAAQPAAATDANDIPVNYLALYKKAGKKYGIPWNVIAGIGRVETNHGRLRAKGVSSGENFAGAGGPMQFLAPTWARYGVDGNGDGTKNRYDPEDAIPAAANYLKASGAPQRMRKAIFAYNHADWYVNDVLRWAERYAAGADSNSDSEVIQAAATTEKANVVDDVGCVLKDLLPISYADLPKGAGTIVRAVLSYALKQKGKPYVWGANGPDAFDCSSLIEAAYKHAFITIPPTTYSQWPFGRKVPIGQEKPGDLAFFEYGRSAGPDHVGLVVDPSKKQGSMFEARRTGVPLGFGDYHARRKNLVGFTRPLARPDIQRMIPGIKRKLERRDGPEKIKAAPPAPLPKGRPPETETLA